ncbi:MAG: transglutaminase family protein [bacterium]
MQPNSFFSNKIVRYISWSIIPIVWLILIGMLYYRNSQRSIIESEAKVDYTSGEVILREDWMRIYLNGEQVGYSKTSLVEGRYSGKKAYLLNNETNLYLLVAGANQNIQVTGNSVLDTDLTLLNFNQELDTGGHRLRVRGVFGEKQLKLVINSGTGDMQRIIPLTTKCYSAELVNLIMLRDNFPIGKKYLLPMFDPTTLTANNFEVETISKSTIEIKGQKYPAFEVQERFKGVTQTIWVNEKGEILKEIANLAGLNLVAIKEFNPDKSELQVVHRSTQDLLINSAIESNREIKNPRDLKELTVKLSNLAIDSIQGQKVENGSVILHVHTIDLDRLPPFTKQINIRQFIHYLAPSPLVQSTDPEIVKKAKEIAGNTPDSVKAASKLTRWVYGNVNKRILLSVPSAVDVLKTREGDCNEHSVLFAALARSLGIPTKIIAGIVYKDEYFFYHAWNEVWVGQWVPVDATFGETAVDATHIKLIEGDLDQQVQLLSLVGKLQVEVQ